jgi:hypothetical protein
VTASHSATPDTESRNVIEACSSHKEDKSSCGLHLMLTMGEDLARPASHGVTPDIESRNVIKACLSHKEDKSSCGLHLMLTKGKIWREASITQRRS